MGDSAGAHEVRRRPYRPAAAAGSRDRAYPVFASGYVFTARGTRPLNDFGAVKTRLDRRIAELNGGKPIVAWTFHDCRRKFRTGLSTLGIAPHIAELCLAHRQPGLARTYDLHRFDQEKRYALNAGPHGPHSSLDRRTPDQAYFTPLPIHMAA